MIKELLKAFILIFIAETGDKTQILAMAFATKFPVKKVLLGIFLGSLLNHSLAVMLGSYISSFIAINTIQIVAGIAFIGFAFWTLKSDGDEDEDEEQTSKVGPVATVALAFFIGELGDKTQLTAITLATDAAYPLAILGGTVLGMIVTGGIGIIVSKKLGDKIPEFAIKIIAASVFLSFGITKLYQTIPNEYLKVQNIAIFIGIITIAVFMMLRSMMLRRQQGLESALTRKSRELHNYYHKAEESVEKICLGPGNCGKCQGNNCIVGYTKTLIKNGFDERDLLQHEFSIPKEKTLNKHYDKKQVLEGLRITLTFIKKDPSNIEYENIHRIRRNFERILFGRSVEQMNDWTEYKRCLIDINEAIAGSVFKGMDN